MLQLRFLRPAASAMVLAGILLLGWCSAWGADRFHTVRRGETLTGIANKYGVPIEQLAQANGLSRTTYVRIGQRLKLPPKRGDSTPAGDRASPPPTATRSRPGALSPALQRAIDKAPVRPGRWRYIVIHHSGVNTGTLQGMDQYHRRVRHMENGLAYHFVIGNGSGMSDGLIAVGRRWNEQLDGGHLASEAQNKIALGICLVGNFDQDRPTPKQLQSLRALVATLLRRCNLPVSAVKVHREINIIGTRCPGARFPTKAFITSLKSAVKASEPRP